VNLDAYRIAAEPYYQPGGDEIAVFEAAFSERLPVMLKGPTGCGKTRFVEHMAPMWPFVAQISRQGRQDSCAVLAS